jgi:hypothetical protein
MTKLQTGRTTNNPFSVLGKAALSGIFNILQKDPKCKVVNGAPLSKDRKNEPPGHCSAACGSSTRTVRETLIKPSFPYFS